MKTIIKYALLFILLFSLLPLQVRSQNPDRNNSSKKFLIESIKVEGNTKSKEGVVYENLLFSVGDKLTENEILENIENINKLGIFKEVTFSPRAGSEAGNLHLTIQVKERYWPRIRFKGGYNEMDSWYLTPISLHFDNIFGFGNFTNFDFTIGDRITSLNFNYINPNIFKSGIDFHFGMHIKNHQFIHYLNDLRLKQNVPQGGYLIGFRSRERIFRKFLFALEAYATTPDSFATYGSSNKKFYNFPDAIEQYVKDKWTTTALSIYYNWDRRDQFAYPTRGWWTGFRLTQADKQLGGQVDFTRFVIDGRYYQHLFSGMVAAVRLKFGTISPDAPFYEKFYLGGPNSLRGFADRSLSPDGGGNQLYQSGMELRFPLTRKNFPNHFLTGVVFWDGGANLSKGQNLSIDSIENSLGFGFRFRIPFIGLLRMDYAYPINEGEKRIHFSLGHTF